MSKRIYLDSTNCTTELCHLGAQFFTDKSPLNPGDDILVARKGFTAVYEMLFAGMRNKEINFCEIGVENGGSVQMWEKYFTKANLFAFELDLNKIEKSKQLTTKTTFLETDVSNEQILDQSFSDTGVLFDIIIDDSTHHISHQQSIVSIASRYLKSGGILIIEDCYRDDADDTFESVIGDNFIFNSFIVCHNDKRSGHNNDKIWYGIKK
jgi:SAM-dependent methyltransferase